MNYTSYPAATRHALGIALLAAVAHHNAAAAVIDNFESYAPGAFPSPTWLDVASVLPEASPLINVPLPSATVVVTSDAHGNSTQAMQTVDALGVSKGIYASVPLSSSYSLFADMRALQYANTSSDPLVAGTASDWAMQLTFAQKGIANFDNTPQAGVYASSQSQGWRLFLIGSNGGPFADIDLNVAASMNTWYSVALQVDTVTGTFHSTISDAESGTVLGDRSDVIAGWAPQFGQFDAIAFFAGEVAAVSPATSGSTTIPNIGQVDNVNVTTTPVPLPGSFALFGSVLGVLAWRSRRRG